MLWAVVYNMLSICQDEPAACIKQNAMNIAKHIKIHSP